MHTQRSGKTCQKISPCWKNKHAGDYHRPDHGRQESLPFIPRSFLEHVKLPFTAGWKFVWPKLKERLRTHLQRLLPKFSPSIPVRIGEFQRKAVFGFACESALFRRALC
ncbi:MAG: hypothetical protein DMG32_11610 [Acidobacteria bacterium]|nr:MAG: hypothetical protein DMG32_11610 [Acidobacteriota bacterium]